MKSEESDDYINFTDFITLNLIGIRVPLYACVCVCVYVCKKLEDNSAGPCLFMQPVSLISGQFPATSPEESFTSKTFKDLEY